MTHEQAKLANHVYLNGIARINGERFPLVSCNELGCFLQDAQGREFFAYWEELWRPDT